MQPGSAYDREVRELSLPSCANQNLSCQLLVVGGGLSGLSAAEAAHKLGLDVIVIEKGTLGKAAASGLNAGQFLTGWAKSVDAMLAELTQQEQQRGAAGDQARIRAERRVRAFLRRTVEGCQRLARLDHEYNLRASVRHGAVMAGLDEADMASLRATYGFMAGGNFRALMPPVRGRRPPFFEFLSARELQQRYGTADGLYVGGVVDHFGGSFRPRKFLIGLARSLQKRGVRFFQHTEAQALDFPGPPVTVFCGNGATIRANTVFMANAYARHINGDVLERTIFEYDYVVDLEGPRAPRCWHPETSSPTCASPASMRAATAEASMSAMRKPPRAPPKSPARSPAGRSRRPNGYFRRCATSARAISRAPGADWSTTRWTTIRSWNASRVDA
jgi:FAD dependent oxidoreductase